MGDILPFPAPVALATPAPAAAAPRMVRRVHAVEYHRNGCGGVGFYLVRFAGYSRAARAMVAIVFVSSPDGVADPRCDGHCAVLNLAEGDKWRGDLYEPELRAAIAAWPIKWGDETSPPLGGTAR